MRRHLCVGKVDTAEGLREKIKELQPDVVVAGLELNGMSDGAAWQKLISDCGKTKMVISWRHHDADKIPGNDAHLARRIHSLGCFAGRICVCRKAGGKRQGGLLQPNAKTTQQPDDATAFAKNPDDTWPKMLYCIWMGYSNKEIAMATRLKESTVKSYRKKLKSITGFRSVAGLEKRVKGEESE